VITGEPVLHRGAEPVTAFDDTLRILVADLFETMDAAPGVGLAAPQVGIGLRLFVYGWTSPDGVEHRGAAVNPRLWTTPVPVGAPDPDGESEGCLSAPGLRFPLRRAPEAVLRAFDVDGQPFERRAEGWLARIFQHEFDHLDGILYLDRLAFPQSRQARRAVRREHWGSPGNSWLPEEGGREPGT
jgi:peptide deformylase